MKPPGASGQKHVPARKRLAALWPHAPLGAAVILVGLLDVLNGLRVPLTLLSRVRALGDIAQSLSVLGGTAQAILGIMLVVGGIGLLWRLSIAWTLTAFLLIVTIGVNAARQQFSVNLVPGAIMLGALMFARRYFTRRTAMASLFFSLSSILAILVYGAVGCLLLGKDFDPPIRDINSAIYFTITELATVGSNFTPTTLEARWFVISLLVFGIGVFASAVASALGPKISTELNRLFNPKEKTMMPKDHVILVGEGSIARNTARELKQRGVVFVQIVGSRVEGQPPDHIVFEGDATNDDILKQAGIEQARLVIAARDDDGENAFITLGAKDLNPRVRTVAVASSAKSIRRLRLARADLVFSPSAVGSRLLADLVEGKQILAEYQDLLEGHAKAGG